MRKVRIESDNHDRIAGLVAGVECVNDSGLAVIDLDCRGQTALVVLEDRDEGGEDAVLRLTVNGIEGQE